MKKAKFADEFKLVAGSCIGHFLEEDVSCKECKIRNKCKKMFNADEKPTSEAEVIEIIKNENV